MTAAYDKHSTDLPDYSDRMCVKLGLAAVNPENGKLRYDWPSIQRAWLLWPNTNLNDFCSHFDLVYRVVSNRKCCRVEEKRQILEKRNIRYRHLVLEEIAVASFGDVESDAKALITVIKDIRETAALGAKWARSKLGKLGLDGRLTPNTAVCARDVKTIMDVNARAAETLTSVFALEEIAKKDDPNRRVREVRPVPVNAAALKIAGA
jgi:hypothetical protein